MTIAFFYLFFSTLLLGFTLGAIRPGIYGNSLATVMSFQGMLITFVMPQVLVVSVGVTAVALLLGAMEHVSGVIGLAMHVASWTALVIYLVRIHKTLPVLNHQPVADRDQPFCEGLTESEREQLQPGSISWRPSLTFSIPAMMSVDVTRDVVYREIDGIQLRLDVYRSRNHSESLPCAIYVHGGGWVTGTRRQSTFMMYELAAAGWAVFSISYRLAPKFPLPAAVEDCKAAVAWVREHAGEYVANSDRIMMLGGSAGGHLTALTALTPGVASFQPGFETADTHIDAAVILYGATDLLAAFGEPGSPAMATLLERLVFKTTYRENPKAFEVLDPMNYVSAAAPPILLVHGTADHVVPFAQSERFYAEMKKVSARNVHLLEIPFGQHAFELLPSPLHQRAVRIMVRWMESIRREWNGTQRSSASPSAG